MKIAKFQRIGHTGWFHIMDAHDDGSDPLQDSFVRVSEYVEVDFPPRPAEEVVPAQLATLDKAEQELRAQFQAKLNEIAEQRAKLKALTWERA